MSEPFPIEDYLKAGEENEKLKAVLSKVGEIRRRIQKLHEEMLHVELGWNEFPTIQLEWEPIREIEGLSEKEREEHRTGVTNCPHCGITVTFSCQAKSRLHNCGGCQQHYFLTVPPF